MSDNAYHPKSPKQKLEPCELEIFTFARQIGVACAICLLVGSTGLIATSGQETWGLAHWFYLMLVTIGLGGTLIVQRFLRILMKHTRKELSIFDRYEMKT